MAYSSVFDRFSLRTRRWVLILSALVLAGIWFGWAIGPGLLFTVTMHTEESEVDKASFSVEDHLVPAGGRSIPMQVYRPANGYSHAVLLAHGVHFEGYKESRLTRFARDLARRGILVAVPDLEDLKNYEMAERTIDDIEAAALYLLDAPKLSARNLKYKPGIYGVSFSGGLSLCAATRPSLRGRLGSVFSFGGHGDLEQVLKYLATGRLPNGESLQPHLYGQTVLLRRVADRLVPPDQVEPLRRALTLFLQEKPAAFKSAVVSLDPEARKIAEMCLGWDSKGVCKVLAPLAPSIRCNPALSPIRGSIPDCPVFLLHGYIDNVIPPSETEALTAWASKGTETHALVTELIRHVELEKKKDRKFQPIETYRLGRFLTKFLRS